MRAGMRTCAVGTQADWTGVAVCSHVFRKFLHRPRRRVFLRGVVNFPAPSFVFPVLGAGKLDRKSTRLNSSHTVISYAVFCLKKKTKQMRRNTIHETPS